jgi:hypothetical protein
MTTSLSCANEALARAMSCVSKSTEAASKQRESSDMPAASRPAPPGASSSGSNISRNTKAEEEEPTALEANADMERAMDNAAETRNTVQNAQENVRDVVSRTEGGRSISSDEVASIRNIRYNTEKMLKQALEEADATCATDPKSLPMGPAEGPSLSRGVVVPTTTIPVTTTIPCASPPCP